MESWGGLVGPRWSVVPSALKDQAPALASQGKFEPEGVHLFP